MCADQLDPLFPELIYNQQRPYMLNYSELIPVCINAIKDLSTQNANLLTLNVSLGQYRVMVEVVELIDYSAFILFGTGRGA